VSPWWSSDETCAAALDTAQARSSDSVVLRSRVAGTSHGGCRRSVTPLQEDAGRETSASMPALLCLLARHGKGQVLLLLSTLENPVPQPSTLPRSTRAQEGKTDAACGFPGPACAEVPRRLCPSTLPFHSLSLSPGGHRPPLRARRRRARSPAAASASSSYSSSSAASPSTSSSSSPASMRSTAPDGARPRPQQPRRGGAAAVLLL
jgi:hypothetical protein